ncbi:MAG: histidine triad nucleotide-binding protein [Chloroflexi bacterium]|jgi:histidine triad (HIT) family protein|nr:histidine triad nucleotide-binding protein [Chloroflexota bacterium]MBT7080101.1 histidine triad nucleotide-binding protein [Chloroflexota bacterium]MBT7290686.1 histidine triad nucleotide-binding protein [Chloroflexota bacterium]
MDCIFCKIAAGQIPSEFIYQDDDFVAFNDIHPQAPTHILIIPKKHIVSIAELADDDVPLLGRMMAVAKHVAQELGLAQNGYRLIINNGPDGGQVVMHLHMHLLGGRKLPDKMK